MGSSSKAFSAVTARILEMSDLHILAACLANGHWNPSSVDSAKFDFFRESPYFE
jgi:hypothetical protein